MTIFIQTTTDLINTVNPLTSTFNYIYSTLFRQKAANIKINIQASYRCMVFTDAFKLKASQIKLSSIAL